MQTNCRYALFSVDKEMTRFEYSLIYHNKNEGKVYPFLISGLVREMFANTPISIKRQPC